MTQNFNISRILLACYVAPNSGDSIHKNRPSHGFAMNMSGVKKYIFDGVKTLTVKKNSVIFLPKHSDYEVVTEEAGGCYAINFDVDEDTLSEPFCIDVKNFARVSEMFKIAERAFRQKRPWYEMQCKAQLYSIICALRSEYEKGYVPGSKRSVISPAIEYIHSEYTSGNIEIPTLARLCGVSEVYFRRLFHDCMGVSPVKYINNLKIERAKELVRSGAGLYSVTQAAELSGFCDICYFYRLFKKEVGMTPSEYADSESGKFSSYSERK